MREIPEADTSIPSHERLNQPQVFRGVALTGLILVDTADDKAHVFNMRVDFGDYQANRQVIFLRSLGEGVVRQLYPGRKVIVTGIEYIAKRKDGKGRTRKRTKIRAEKVDFA